MKVRYKRFSIFTILTQRYRKKFNTCKSGLTVAPLLFFIANSPPDSFRFAIFWASRNIAGRAFKIFVALTISGRRHTRAVSRTCQVMPLTWARVNTEIKKTNLKIQNTVGARNPNSEYPTPSLYQTF